MSRGLRFALAWCVMSGAGCASVRVHRFSGAPAPIASVAMVGFRGTPTAIADGIREGCRQAILRRQLRVVSADYRTLSASGQENFVTVHAQKKIDIGSNRISMVGSTLRPKIAGLQSWSCGFRSSNRWRRSCRCS